MQITFIFYALLLFLERKSINLILWEQNICCEPDASYIRFQQLQNRFKILDPLYKCWKDESFPINTTHKRKIPQIMDQSSTMYAVAYVMYNSGQQNLISYLAQNNNYVLIDDVPDSHALIDSLKQSGISNKKLQKFNLCIPVMP